VRGTPQCSSRRFSEIGFGLVDERELRCGFAILALAGASCSGMLTPTETMSE